MIISIAQSDDERRNQAFIRSHLKMHPPAGSFRFNDEGFWGCDSHCQLEIIGALVIATEVETNEGTSITNMAEHLATRVCYHDSIDSDKLIWIEHYPERGPKMDTFPETWDRVTFEKVPAPDGAIRFLHPRWKPMDGDVIEKMKRNPHACKQAQEIY